MNPLLLYPALALFFPQQCKCVAVIAVVFQSPVSLYVSVSVCVFCRIIRQIRRERRSVYEDAGVNVTAYQGEDITNDMLDTAFFIYKSTIDKVR